MSLISLQFAALLAAAAALFHVSPIRFRPAVLFAVSVLFCALASMAAAVALVSATVFAFYIARNIEKTASERNRRILLAAGVGVLLGHLLLVKLIPTLKLTTDRQGLIHAFATFGASYYTLKLVGYLVDVFWGRYRAWDRITAFGAFSTFFPLLPGGPIQRANEFSLPSSNGQISELMTYGLRRILLGLLKKLLIADRLGGLVNYIADDPHAHSAVLWVMAYLFPLQLYVDFSALTDIGIGAAAVFGIRTPENFAFPFFASNISEFWRRWHMSLTRWLGDYVFMPLRMATRSFGNWGLCLSIVVNMTLIGMWHAISFGWALFGLINAAFLIGDSLTVRLRRRRLKDRAWAPAVTAALGPILVYHMIAFSLVCFRAQTLPEIGYYFGHLFNGLNAPSDGLRQLFYSYGRGRCAYDFAAVCSFIVFDAWQYLRANAWQCLSRIPPFGELPRTLRWALYYVAMLSIAIASQQNSRFIYVQF